MSTCNRDDDRSEGWFNTRDAGHLDDDGFLFVHGRLDDVIVRGGENLSPGEIEDVLLEHPAVAEAAVVGVPDTEWGEKVVAAVVLHEGAKVEEAELQDLVRSKLRSTRTPEHIDIRDELPYNETGKLAAPGAQDRAGRRGAPRSGRPHSGSLTRRQTSPAGAWYRPPPCRRLGSWTPPAGSPARTRRSCSTKRARTSCTSGASRRRAGVARRVPPPGPADRRRRDRGRRLAVHAGRRRRPCRRRGSFEPPTRG